MTLALNSREFFKTFKEALIAYSFNFGGILAGFMVAYQLNVFQLSPWAIAVYPTILTAKGFLAGLLSGRLSTALHLGSIYPRFFANTKSLYRLFAAMVILTLGTSTAMSLVSMVFGNMFWNITFADFSDILVVVTATMALGLSLFLFTASVAFASFKKGLDPDIIVYPIMSTVADIFITVCYILTLNLFFLFGLAGKFTVTLVGLLPIVLIMYLLPRNIHGEEFVETIKEAFLTLIFVAFIVNITGTILHRINAIVEGRKEIYTVYPALIDLVGDVGSVVGSTATTKLALGLLKPSFSAMRNHATQIFGAWAVSVILFVLFSASSLVINGLFTLYSFLELTSLLLTVNMLAVATIILTSYAVSILTFKKGLDPDNFVIPIESSLADSITTIALLAALLLMG